MGGGDAAVPVPWNRLRAWIDQNEAIEKARRKNNLPGSGLSLQQLQAISLLISVYDDDEPAMDGADHVSALMMLIQKRGYKQPVFQDLDPVDIPNAGITMKRWRVVCRIASATEFPDGFPALGYGIDDAAKGVPLFKSKKLAKQYAAMHARAFLMNVPPSLPKAVNNEPPPAQQQQQQQQQHPSRTRTYGDVIREREAATSHAGPASRNSDYGSDDDMDGGHNYSARSAIPGSGSGYGNGSGSGSGSGSSSGYGNGHAYNFAASPRHSGDFASEDGPSVVARVAQLAGTLGLESPRYDLVEETTPGWFTGRGVFHSVSPMPAECTVVRGVLGKAKAKEEVARRMLRWLEAEEATRNRNLEEMMMMGAGVKQEL